MARSRPAAVASHPFSVHDLWAMKRIGDPQVSPDGRAVVFVLTSYDTAENKSTADLWLVGVDGTGLRRLTTHSAKPSNPRWSPDGRFIYFLSARTETSQVWRIPVDGGEAEQITREPLDLGSLAISPDGRYLAFSMEVFPGRSPTETKSRLDEIAKQKATGKVYDRLFIRHWDTWKDGRRSHLFVMPLAAEGPTQRRGSRAGGSLRSPGGGVDVMKRMDADVPSKPFGGAEDFTFTPDSRSVVFSARDAGREEAWSTAFNLYEAPVDGSRPPRCLTSPNQAVMTHPVFSPDGRTLAWLAMSRPGYESDRLRIMLRAWGRAADPRRGVDRSLTQGWDRSAGTIVWSSDGRTIYTVADHLGQHSLFAVDVKTGRVRTIVESGYVTTPLVAGDRIVFGYCDLRGPTELHSIRPDGRDHRVLTRINAPQVAAARMGEPEQFTFAGWGGEPVYAYVVRPVDFKASRKYPVAFLIHGGPQGSFGNMFHYRWNPQVYAGAGYAVVMVDFHGSTGYGQAFTDSIRDDWGGKPLVDLQKGLAAALERYPWMDGKRVAALGASYGGYMINWIAGQWPDRFRCLVNHDGNLDERMAYYDTEELWFPEWERHGPPWERPFAYTKHNPIEHVHRWKTPMLVIHGGRDFRVVDTQGISTFTALQRRGIPSKLLYFPDENHWVLKPANSVQWHETVLAWLRQWTR